MNSTCMQHFINYSVLIFLSNVNFNGDFQNEESCFDFTIAVDWWINV